MASIYDACADAFQSQASGLFTWKAVGAPALDRVLARFYARPDLPSLRWLDEGSASGRLVAHLIKRGVPAGQISGVEISPEQVALARRAFGDVEFHVGNIATDDLGLRKYDVVTRHMVDEHLSDDDLLAASKNTLAAIKPGGTFVAVFTHPDRVIFTERDRVGPDGSYITRYPWGAFGTNYYRSVNQYVDILTKAGFSVDSVEGMQISPDAASIDPAEYKRYMDAGYADLNVRLVVVAHKPTEEEPPHTRPL